MVDLIMKALSNFSDPTIKQLILRMNDRQHDLVIEVSYPCSLFSRHLIPCKKLISGSWWRAFTGSCECAGSNKEGVGRKVGGEHLRFGRWGEKLESALNSPDYRRVFNSGSLTWLRGSSLIISERVWWVISSAPFLFPTIRFGYLLTCVGWTKHSLY